MMVETKCFNCGVVLLKYPSEIKSANTCKDCHPIQRKVALEKAAEAKRKMRETRICVECGKSFIVAQSRKKQTCGAVCAAKYTRQRQVESGRKYSAETYEQKPCPACGKMFFNRRKARQRFCSIGCLARHNLSQPGHAEKMERAKVAKLTGIHWSKQIIDKRAAPMLMRPQTAEKTKCGPTNKGARVGTLRDPCGQVWPFRNLTHFVRTHQELFDDEDVLWLPQRRGHLSVSCRAAKRLLALFGRGRKVPGTWKGWTVVSETEEGCDLLDRQIMQNDKLRHSAPAEDSNNTKNV